jgi:hypothetical protein
MGPVGGWEPAGEGKAKREGEGKVDLLKYFKPKGENRTVKPAEIVLRRE